MGSLALAVTIGLASTTTAETPAPVTPSTDAPAEPEGTNALVAPVTAAEEVAVEAADAADAQSSSPTTTAAAQTGASAHGAPYGPAFPVTLESNFARPYRSVSSNANADWSQLDELERIIRGTYINPVSKSLRPASERNANFAYMSVSRMEDSIRVGRELAKAARYGVRVRFIHPADHQSSASRSLQRALNKKGLRDSLFKICQKGKSNACLSSVRGGIIHTKMLITGNTFTQANEPARSAVWTGSANIGGPSGARTYNNGVTIYNDAKLTNQMKALYTDMLAEKNVGNNMRRYLAAASTRKRYGYAGATAAGYTSDYVSGAHLLYSNLSNFTVHTSPIAATPNNGLDPVINLLNRVQPDAQCRIRVQQNRFKYRRIGVAQRLVELANAGCEVSAVAFEDDLALNRTLHCQQYIRICKPVLNVLRTANRRIDVAWAKPHDKVILVDALLRRNPLNPEEVAVDGTRYANWGGSANGTGTVRTRLVQAGSAGLTGSNLIASDEITTETTDGAIYDDYLEHWKAIWKSYEIYRFPY